MSRTSPGTLFAGEPAAFRDGSPSVQPDIGWRAWMLPAFALACWGLAIRHLSGEWTANEQYHFGWLVPLLAAYLIKVRFEQLPQPAPTPHRGFAAALVLLLSVAAGFTLLIREANLDWRLVDWALVTLAVAATLLCFWQIGGLPWVRHFAFPLLFFLIAVPLPRNLEYPWMDRLMLTNAQVSGELLRWLGVEATTRGNLIQLPSGMLGVEEACSGIRSLHSTLMFSLFLGEILALSSARRLILLGSGVAWALATNIGRTSVLGWFAARDGIAAVDHWHDTAGFSVLALSTLTVAATGWLLHRTSRHQPASGDGFRFDLPGLQARLRPLAGVGAAGLALLLAGWVGTRLWFDSHERSLSTVTEWELTLPADQPYYRDVSIPSRTHKILNYDEGYSGMWKDAANQQWQAYYFRWHAGRSAGQTAKPHDPRSCLGSIGMELSAVLPPISFARQDVSLTFDAFHFLDRGRSLYVFNCLAEDVRTADGLRQAMYVNSPAARVAAAFAGRRQAGQRRVEVVVWDAPDAATASQRFTAMLDRQIRVTPHRLN